jgi:hypothetical protein
MVFQFLHIPNEIAILLSNYISIHVLRYFLKFSRVCGTSASKIDWVEYILIHNFKICT